jgi:Icc-related predicted phosphoesterase
MRVLLIGDLHGEISAVGRIVATLERRFDFVPDIVVQVGDWGFFANEGEWPRVLSGEIALPQIPTYIVHGNHDGYVETRAAMERWEAAGEPAVDLLITHEAPTGCGALGEWRYGSPWRSGSPGIRQLWERVDPQLMVCGHYHQELAHTEGNRTLRVLPLAGEGAAIYDTATRQITAFSPPPA